MYRQHHNKTKSLQQRTVFSSTLPAARATSTVVRQLTQTTVPPEHRNTHDNSIPLGNCNRIAIAISTTVRYSKTCDDDNTSGTYQIPLGIMNMEITMACPRNKTPTDVSIITNNYKIIITNLIH